LVPVHVVEQVRPGTVGLELEFRGIEGRVNAGHVNERGMRLGIVVVRREGRDEPVAFAPLDDELHFAIHGLPEGAYRLSYKAGLTGSETMSVDGGRHVPAWRIGVVLRLARGATIEGLVLDQNGEPRAGVRVRATSGSILTRAHTRVDGSFVVEGLERDREYLLTTWCAGYVPERRDGIRPDATGIVFGLDPGLRTTGRVVDEHGEPVTLANLDARVKDGPELPCHTQSAAGGRFELAGLPDGMIELTVRKHKRLATFTFRAGDRDLVFVLK
jgi:hypothetical protein